jgi:hypothetical protein
LGAAISPRQSFVSGMEVSCGRMTDRGWWAGGYADMHWSFANDQARLSMGPMAGWWFLGADGGYLLVHDAAGVRHGLAVRPFLTLGYAAFYYRWGALLSEKKEYLSEVGLLIEFPIPLTKRPEPEPPRPAPPVVTDRDRGGQP